MAIQFEIDGENYTQSFGTASMIQKANKLNAIQIAKLRKRQYQIKREARKKEPSGCRFILTRLLIILGIIVVTLIIIGMLLPK